MEESMLGFDEFSVELGEYDVRKVKKFDRVWKVGEGGSLCELPMIHDGIVYFGACNKLVYAVSVKTGLLVWKFKTQGIMVHSSPVYWDGKVYIGSFDHNMYALDAKTGELVWKYKTDEEVAVTPCIYKGRIYFGSRDQFVYCLDARTGRLIWKFKTFEEIVAVPAVHDGRLFIGSFDKNLYCLDAETGRLIWKYQTQGEIHNLAPILVHEGIVYFATFDNYLYAVDEHTGRLIWRFPTGKYGNSSTPVIYEGFIYHVSRDGILFKLTMQGKLVWKYTKPNMLSIPTIYEDRIYIGCEDRNLYCLDLEGREMFRFETQGAIWLRPVVGEGIIAVPSWDCHVYALDVKDHKLRWKFRTDGAPSILPPPYESFEMVMRIPEAKVEEEKKKAYDLDMSGQEELGTSAYKSRVTYQISTQYSEKGKYQVDSQEESF